MTEIVDQGFGFRALTIIDVGQRDAGDHMAGVIEDGRRIADGDVLQLSPFHGVAPGPRNPHLLRKLIRRGDGSLRIGDKLGAGDHIPLLMGRQECDDGLAQGCGVGGARRADGAGGQPGFLGDILIHIDNVGPVQHGHEG